MAVTAEASKYKNRSVDFAILHGAVSRGEVPVTLELLKNHGGVCTGIQKLVQRFTLALLTPYGSMTMAPERGCHFMKQMHSVQSAEQAGTQFRLAVMTVAEQLREEETEDMPEDERYGSVELTDVTLIGSTVSIACSLVSRAGVGVEVILPVYTE